MAIIENIYGGDSITVENIGQNAVRINLECREVEPKLDVPIYFDYRYSQSKLSEGDESYYANIYNCIFRVNGKYVKIDDILTSWTFAASGTYDIYIRIQENPVPPNEFTYEVYSTIQSDDKINIPRFDQDYHLFRVKRVNELIEFRRIIPMMLEVTCCRYGFVVYHDYELKLVRNSAKHDNPPYYLGIPSYSINDGPVLLETEIRKDEPYQLKSLVYKGANRIILEEYK